MAVDRRDALTLWVPAPAWEVLSSGAAASRRMLTPGPLPCCCRGWSGTVPGCVDCEQLVPLPPGRAHEPRPAPEALLSVPSAGGGSWLDTHVSCSLTMRSGCSAQNWSFSEGLDTSGDAGRNSGFVVSRGPAARTTPHTRRRWGLAVLWMANEEAYANTRSAAGAAAVYRRSLVSWPASAPDANR